MRFHLWLGVGLVVCVSCGPKRAYDTSTPEKFVEALGQVGQRPEDENPVPFFYDQASSEKITRYDEAGVRAKGAFDTFKSRLANAFPNRVLALTETSIQVRSGDEDFLTESFSLTANSVSNQIRGRKASDYQYISANALDGKGLVKLKLKIQGAEVEIDLKKENGHYVMFLNDENLELMERMTKFLVASEQLFSYCAEEIENGALTEENFNKKIFDWSFTHISNFSEM